VQKWRGTDWPKNHYSKATFELNEVSEGTELAFTQTGVPEKHYRDIEQGWTEHYWNKMRKMLGS
jgi:activator of HSP90 ATPase